MPLRFNDLRQARSLTVSPTEKAAVRDRLQAFAEANPVRETDPVRHIQQRSNLLRPAFAFAVILLLVGAGTASAAEQALPDNAPLYFVKTSINEPVKRFLALTPEAKASVEAELVTRRLEETETLAATGRLSPAIQAQGEVRFIQQVEKAQEKINQLDNKGKQQAAQALSVRLEQKLQVHTEKLEKIDAASKSDVTLTPMLKRLRGKTEALIHEREQRADDHETEKQDQQNTNDQDQQRKSDKRELKRPPSNDGQEHSIGLTPTSTASSLRGRGRIRLEQRRKDSLNENDSSDDAPTTTLRELHERSRGQSEQ